MNKKDNNELLAIAQAALDRARRFGADAADVDVVDGRSVSATSRLGKMEDVSRAEGQDLALRVFVGQSSAVVSTNDFSAPTLDGLAERAVAMARLAPADEYAGLAEAALLASSWPNLDLFDPTSPDADALFAMALETEDAARGVKGITNSLGASAGASHRTAVLATSAGFSGCFEGSRFSVSAGVVSGTGTGMENDYAYSLARHLADVDPAGAIGLEAGSRATKRANPKKPATFSGTVVFEPRIARMLVGHLAGAINGRAVSRGASFLKSKMGEQVFAPGVSVLDDPLRPRGTASRPFDGEGLAARQVALVTDGKLQSWILDLASARQLGLAPTGQASRGGGTPGPSAANLYLEAGTASKADLIGTIDDGVFITDLIGMGVNIVSGDYSRGASGFLIENGEITHPVSGFTIAGHLTEMFTRAVPANDLEFKYATNAPTVAIEGMTIAGT
ncbi:TldE protein, part of TldE/TldD proteolytic complex [hydrothermal vent metagenome]|uniref:TldE protein, part of TldE/TldD proteolytic complex n=1 Tax=hydrothermal vent metagenome TaxID=652676 RepID=A0A3B0TJ20_9ZZZZ